MNNMEEKELTEVAEIKSDRGDRGNRCSCYDDDCQSVVDPFYCFMGGRDIGVADGYCPLIHDGN